MELMFTVVFLLLVAMVPFMECRGVVVLRWDFLSAGSRRGVFSFYNLISTVGCGNEELEDSGII